MSMFALLSKLFSILKVGLFSEMGGQTLHQAVKQHLFSQFLKVQQQFTILSQKNTAVLIESEDKPNRSYISETFLAKN